MSGFGENKVDGNQAVERAGWCILRTSGGRTLPVAKSLAAAGFDVWTPVRTTKVRVPRSKRVVERQVAMMPTFVFARIDRVDELIRVLALPSNPHPRFGIFRHQGKLAVVAEGEIAGLKAAEDRETRALLRTKKRIIDVGTKYAPKRGGFAGMHGVVECGDGKFALVSFGGRFVVKIATFLMSDDELHPPQSTQDTAALAA